MLWKVSDVRLLVNRLRVLTPKKLVVLKMESFFVYKQILVKQDANMSHDIPPCQHKHEITWLSCNQAWRTIKEKQSHVATPRCHVFVSQVPIRDWQHGKKLCDIRHNVLERFLESKCVHFLFLFSVLFVFLFVSLFFFFLFFFSGAGGWGTIFPQLYKSMEPRRWRYYWTRFFAPCKSWILDSTLWIPDSGFRFLGSGVSGFLWRIF